uniref:HR-like lesion-inducer n=1 Tax=Kalanchoe fedtschenkoi TaxID=63787 RepID=A0A7N0USZ4_KALFE
MGFASFIGRLLFASVFLLAAWQEYNSFSADGGPAARSLKVKIDAFSRLVSSRTDVKLPPIDAKSLVAASIAMKGLGGILFVVGSSVGANILLIHQVIFTPILYDFYKHDVNKKAFTNLLVPFVQNIALLGALLLYIDMNNSTPKRHQLKRKGHKPKAN